MPLNSTRGAASIQGFIKSNVGSSGLVPGDFYAGGYYVGVMEVGATKYALVMSPKAQGQTQGALPIGTVGSRWDGVANTNQLSGSAANWVRALSINGFIDWYIPAIDELELMYRNLKPTTNANVTGNVPPNNGTLITNPNGTNPSSQPRGAAYTTTSPAQTAILLFQAGGAQCLDSTTGAIATWSSTYPENGSYAYFQRHDAGEENVASATGNTLTLRAVRRVAL